MLISISCSWCHTLNPTTERHCKECGHDVGKARMDCQCPQCSLERQAYAQAALNVGERVILTCADPQQDGRRGTIVAVHPCDTYDVKFDDSILVQAWLGGNRLEKEVNYPHYPQPQTQSEEEQR